MNAQKSSRNCLEVELKSMKNGMVLASCKSVPSLFLAEDTIDEAIRSVKKTVENRFQRLRLHGQTMPEIIFHTPMDQ